MSLQSNEDVPSSEYIVIEADTEARRFQEPIDDDGSTISGLHVIIIHTETFVPHSKFNLEYRTKCRLFVLQKQVRVSVVVLKAVLHFTESPSRRSNEDVPSSEYVVTEAATEARIFQEPVEDVGSTVNGHEVMIIYTETFIPQFNFQISKYALLIFENLIIAQVSVFLFGFGYIKIRTLKFCIQLASNF